MGLFDRVTGKPAEREAGEKSRAREERAARARKKKIDLAWKELTKDMPDRSESKSVGGSDTPLTPLPG